MVSAVRGITRRSAHLPFDYHAKLVRNRHWAVDGITDSNRIAFLSGKAGWDVLAISILNGQARTLVSGGFASWPDWAPSGTHFLFAVSLEEIPGIYDRQAGEEGLSRRFV